MKARTGKKTTQAERYQTLVAGTIELLEKGIAPWRKEWAAPRGPNSNHHNGNSGHQYKGFNPFGLDVAAMLRGYQSKTREGYHSTAFHEAAHSTGHKSRLDRHSLQEEAGSVWFGSPVYSKEELVAELTASFLCDAAGITNTQEHSAAYLENWLGVIRKDGKFLVQASTKAQHAADFILAGGPKDAAKEKDEGYFKPQARKPGA
jgi:antirestriction protein ArdC